MDLHQRHEPVNLRVFGNELGEDTTKPKSVLAELWSHPVVAPGGGVALVEDEVDDLQHGGEADREVVAPRNLEGHARLAEGPLRPDDALGDGGLRHEEGPCDLAGGKTAQQVQRERYARVRREDRMAGDENEPQEIVADVLVNRSLEVRCGCWHGTRDLTPDRLMLALE